MTITSIANRFNYAAHQLRFSGSTPNYTTQPSGESSSPVNGDSFSIDTVKAKQLIKTYRLETVNGEYGQIIQSQHKFAQKMFEYYAPQLATKNTVMSPLSAWVVANMLLMGLEGEDFKKAATDMGYTSSFVNENEYDVKAAIALAITKDQVAIQEIAKGIGATFDANQSVWKAKGESFKPTFEGLMNAMKATYGDFNDADATPINEWIKSKVPSIDKALNNNDVAGAAFVLVNTLKFKANWEQTFDPNLTKPHSFKRPDGTVVKVPMMSQPLQLFDNEGKKTNDPNVGKIKQKTTHVKENGSIVEKPLFDEDGQPVYEPKVFSDANFFTDMNPQDPNCASYGVVLAFNRPKTTSDEEFKEPFFFAPTAFESAEQFTADNITKYLSPEKFITRLNNTINDTKGPNYNSGDIEIFLPKFKIKTELKDLKYFFFSVSQTFRNALTAVVHSLKGQRLPSLEEGHAKQITTLEVNEIGASMESVTISAQTRGAGGPPTFTFSEPYVGYITDNNAHIVGITSFVGDKDAELPK